MFWIDSKRQVFGEGPMVELGQFAQVWGKLEWRKGIPCITATRVICNTHPEAELMWWLDLTAVHERVYSREFRLSLPSETESSLREQSQRLQSSDK